MARNPEPLDNHIKTEEYKSINSSHIYITYFNVTRKKQVRYYANYSKSPLIRMVRLAKWQEGGSNLSNKLTSLKYELESKPLSLGCHVRFSGWGLILSLFPLQLQCALP